jgi:hypothetical protein
LLSGLLGKLGADGAVGLQESGLDRKTFDALDADQDGTVSADELKEALKAQYTAMLAQMRLGMSENSSSSSPADEPGKSETRTAPADLPSAGAASPPASGGQTSFDAMDTNQDGTVSAEELMAALQQQSGSAESGENSAAPSRKTADSLLAAARHAYSAVSGMSAAPEQTVSLKA